MSTISTLIRSAAALTAGLQGVGFLHGFTFQTEVFYDALGALNSISFVPLSLAIAGNNGNLSISNLSSMLSVITSSTNSLWQDNRSLMSATLFTTSRLWLLAYLSWRAMERKGDGRFDHWKTDFAKFMIVWIMQGTWVLCVAMPFLVIAGASTMGSAQAGLTLFDYACGAAFCGGLVCEIVSDVQKAIWVKRGRPGGFFQDGLWKYSRHPNYFGEMLMWISAWGLTLRLATNGIISWNYCALAGLSPLITCGLLLFVSGIPTGEGKNLKRYYESNFAREYVEYRTKTSPVWPMPNSLWLGMPDFLKKTIFCEWDRYAYKPALE